MGDFFKLLLHFQKSWTLNLELRTLLARGGPQPIYGILYLPTMTKPQSNARPIDPIPVCFWCGNR